MELQLYFYKPMMRSYMRELEIVGDYYYKSKPVFEISEDYIYKEVDKIFSSYVISEDTDPSVIADSMEEMGVELFESYQMMKSNHLFITISMLAHMWEQQIIKFIRRELNNDLKDPIGALTYKDAKETLEDFGVKVTKRASWTKIKELRHLVNTIKHGEGVSAAKLRKLRPDFFTGEGFFKDDNYDILKLNGSVLLDPYSLNVTESDLFDYIKATKTFWEEMPERAFYNIRTQTSRIVQND
ncbi:hypothetical protein [Bacillus sp. AFS040349]|uniref:hypothetical protein n=1 Tax=Bacillus sp. AFS040349 TaxID=2033502 RepID=UPI000BFD98BE|nr:hypothetical protein [Bacillus sp. AFS040349]PGT79153.1 hypothetical protein COD11_22985 [Bacillus sp. AFS040349]